MEVYYVKCKKKTEIKDSKEVTMKNGRAAVTGTCSVCGTKVFRIKLFVFSFIEWLKNFEIYKNPVILGDYAKSWVMVPV